jgi:hypothetical protein
MTNEEKLKRLLEVAVENGWEDKKDLLNNFESIVDNIYLYIDDIDFVGTLHSLNDLVCNWEEGEISFIDAISYGMTYDMDDNDPFDRSEPKPIPSYWFREMWCNIPTSQRLNWLFDTFKHLL